ncbi:helix-turn-helix transcriptional regulator [Desulfobotulus mexicanus]|uniref:WYL domain-containing protein n=1 Tax=Desulfobotulus mexicanus TaxID=2586642 RepID=A0A5Q4VE67_9BACT|nr:WYL domain-containing protein [Desulfobotulus mexicanus]TYT75226.1 WYL domain-containing protein [Desulfobotulus mexicanus]
MGNTYRQCLILQMLPREPLCTDTASLERRLREKGIEVHRRTIQRDLEELSRVFPIACNDNEKPYGWFWSINAEAIHLPQMNPITAFSFRMIEAFLHSVMPPAALKTLEPHFSEASNILDAVRAESFRSWPDKVKILSRTQPLKPPHIDAAILNTVYEGLMDGKRIQASYRKRGEEASTDYTINPLGIVLLDSVIYLVCTMRDYQRMEDVRQLALHRFLSATLLEKPGLVPEGFSMQGYIDSGAFTYLQGNQPMALEFLMEKSVATHLFETPLSEDQRITPHDELRVKVEATVLDTAQIRWWLLGFGEFVQVMKPEKLREAFGSRVKKMHSMYA